MNLLQLNKNRRNKLSLMLSILFQEFSFIRVKKSGLVVMKKKWYSLRSTKVQSLDLCLTELPERMAAYRLESDVYYKRYLMYLTFLLRSNHKNIVEYLFEEFMRLNIVKPVKQRKDIPVRYYNQGNKIQKLSNHMDLYLKQHICYVPTY
jgi:hypothetical protein